MDKTCKSVAHAVTYEIENEIDFGMDTHWYGLFVWVSEVPRKTGRRHLNSTSHLQSQD